MNMGIPYLVVRKISNVINIIKHKVKWTMYAFCIIKCPKHDLQSITQIEINRSEQDNLSCADIYLSVRGIHLNTLHRGLLKIPVPAGGPGSDIIKLGITIGGQKLGA